MPTDQTHGTHSLATTRKLHDLTRSKAALLAENVKDGKKSGAPGQLGSSATGRVGVMCGRSSAACKD